MKLHRLVLFFLILQVPLNYGFSQESYAIRYENGQPGKRWPKYIKIDTLKKNNNIEVELRNLNLKLIEFGYFLNETSLLDSNNVCLVNLGRKFNDIILTGIAKTSLILPMFIFLLTEAIFIARILNKKD